MVQIDDGPLPLFVLIAKDEYEKLMHFMTRVGDKMKQRSFGGGSFMDAGAAVQRKFSQLCDTWPKVTGDVADILSTLQYTENKDPISKVRGTVWQRTWQDSTGECRTGQDRTGEYSTVQYSTV